MSLILEALVASNATFNQVTSPCPLSSRKTTLSERVEFSWGGKIYIKVIQSKKTISQSALNRPQGMNKSVKFMTHIFRLPKVQCPVHLRLILPPHYRRVNPLALHFCCNFYNTTLPHTSRIVQQRRKTSCHCLNNSNSPLCQRLNTIYNH